MMDKITLTKDLSRSEIAQVFETLSVAGDEVRFVGGCVRDGVLNRPIKDVDLATTAEPGLVMERLRAAGIKALPTGIEHGTITAVNDGLPIEVTTLRRDVKTDGRRAVVAFTKDWREDALRRDLTMNALSMDRKGQIYDFFGGVQDAHQGIVRFVGDAEQRIREDALRILRFFRFYAFYGKPEGVDLEGLDACTRCRDLIATLSAERIRQELLCLLTADTPAPTIKILGRTGIWSILDLGPACVDALASLSASDPLLRLAAVIGSARTAEHTATRLRLSRAELNRLKAWQEVLDAPPQDETSLRRALYFQGSDAVGGAARLALSSEKMSITVPQPAWQKAQEAAQDWQKPTFPLSGSDVSLPPGPALGTVLREVEAWWIDNAFKPDRSACLGKLWDIETAHKDQA